MRTEAEIRLIRDSALRALKIGNAGLPTVGAMLALSWVIGDYRCECDLDICEKAFEDLIKLAKARPNPQDN